MEEEKVVEVATEVIEAVPGETTELIKPVVETAKKVKIPDLKLGSAITATAIGFAVGVALETGVKKLVRVIKHRKAKKDDYVRVPFENRDVVDEDRFFEDEDEDPEEESK